MQTITVKCKLTLSDDQREAIDKTLVAFANAANDAIGVGRQMGSTSNVRIHGKCYHAIRTAHGLSANLAVRAIARAAGIRDGIKVRPSQRRRHHAWAFYQLKSFIAYKAAIAGVPVERVDPRYTSRTCSQCGHCEKANRKSQSEFVCKHCQYSANADVNAAINIAAGGVHKPSRESTQVAARAAA